MKATSRSSYLQHVVDGHSKSQRERILDCLATSGPLTRFQIARQTGIRLTSVCGRVNALLENCQLVITHEGRDPLTGKVAEYLRVDFVQAKMF